MTEKITVGSVVQLAGSAKPMSVEQITDGGANAICTRDAEVVGTYPIEALELVPHVQPTQAQAKHKPIR